MERTPNPYHPGFNQAPEVLAGRDEILEAVNESLDVAAVDKRTPRPHVLIGSRGVGKTVLLSELAALAARLHGWPTAFVEVRPDTPFTAQLVERLDAVTEALDETPAGHRFRVERFSARAGAFGTSAGVEMARRAEPVERPSSDIEAALRRVCEAAMAKDAGIVLAMDEVQFTKRPEVADLAAALQQHVPDRWPLVVLFASLPNIRERERSVTYLERSEWHELGLLNLDDTLLALTGPAAGAGRPLTPDAAMLLARASGGYPYAVQHFGSYAWRASDGADRIEADHARQAIPRAEASLGRSLYAGRWGEATDKEREYLTALAAILAAEGSATGGEVARHLGVTAKEVSYLRDRLSKKGTIVTAGRDIQFPIPGMGTWILGRRD